MCLVYRESESGSTVRSKHDFGHEDDCGRGPHVNAHGCEHQSGCGSETLASAGLECAHS